MRSDKPAAILAGGTSVWGTSLVHAWVADMYAALANIALHQHHMASSTQLGGCGRGLVDSNCVFAFTSQSATRVPFKSLRTGPEGCASVIKELSWQAYLT